MDIGTAQMASLDALAFEGATKRSKPNLKVRELLASPALGQPVLALTSGRNACVRPCHDCQSGYGARVGMF